MDEKGFLLTQFLGNVRLEIPPWQRRYSWATENWEALWRSLEEVADGRRVAPHFLGALVFQGEKAKARVVQHGAGPYRVQLTGSRSVLRGWAARVPVVGAADAALQATGQ